MRPLQRDGRRFIELADPVTGARLCLSGLGYSVAFLFDGGTLESVVTRARQALHVELTTKRLSAFAERLASFGFLLGSRADAAAPRVASASRAACAADASGPVTCIDPERPASPVEPAATMVLSGPEMDAVLREAMANGAAPGTLAIPASKAPLTLTPEPQPVKREAKPPQPVKREAKPPQPVKREAPPREARPQPQPRREAKPSVRVDAPRAVPPREARPLPSRRPPLPTPHARHISERWPPLSSENNVPPGERPAPGRAPLPSPRVAVPVRPIARGGRRREPSARLTGSHELNTQTNGR